MLSRGTMRILFIVTSLDDKAPANVAKALALYQIEKGNEVVFGYFDEIIKIDIPCKKIKLSMNEPIDFDNYDIIHSHMYRPDKYVAKYSSLINRAKTISTMHCHLYEDLKYSYGRFVATIFTPIWISCLKKFDCVVEISNHICDLYSRFFICNKKIYNGVKLQLKQEADCFNEIKKVIVEYKEKGYIVVLSYSGIIKRKGLEQVIRLAEKDSQIAYVCIGEGNYKKALLQMVNSKDLGNRVSFFGFIKAPYYLLEYADVFIIPSYSEGFSLALLEAGMMKSSVVCSNIKSFIMHYNQEEVSFFELRDTLSLSAAVHEAYENKELKGKRLFDKINLQYTQRKMCEQYDELYNEIKKQKRRK